MSLELIVAVEQITLDRWRGMIHVEGQNKALYKVEGPIAHVRRLLTTALDRVIDGQIEAEAERGWERRSEVTR